ncbi:MAG: hypothetical protein JKY50_00530 [Oleispira sp.]|nr:hypothetical protein [Oleispira sp.]
MENQLVELTNETAMKIFTGDNGLDSYVQQVVDEVNSFEHDLKTAAGRAKTISLASKVAKIKVKYDDCGKDLVSGWKKDAATVDKARKKMRDTLDELKVLARKPVTDWEAEQERLEDEKKAKLEAEMKAAQVESDHEIGLLMNEKIDRELAEEVARLEAQAKAEAERIERERLEREDRLKSEAAAAATAEANRIARETEQRIEYEKQEAIQREQAAKQAQANAEREAIAAQEREKYAEEQSEHQRKQAAIDAKNARVQAEEQRKQDAIMAEKSQLAAIESAKQAEIFRQQEEKRIADEDQARLEANKKHVGMIRGKIKTHLMESCGIDEATAKKVVLALLKTDRITINY